MTGNSILPEDDRLLDSLGPEDCARTAAESEEVRLAMKEPLCSGERIDGV
jgi:hypothetical protein